MSRCAWSMNGDVIRRSAKNCSHCQQELLVKESSECALAVAELRHEALRMRILHREAAGFAGRREPMPHVCSRKAGRKA